jgi:hypothetical protein
VESTRARRRVDQDAVERAHEPNATIETGWSLTARRRLVVGQGWMVLALRQVIRWRARREQIFVPLVDVEEARLLTFELHHC